MSTYSPSRSRTREVDDPEAGRQTASMFAAGSWAVARAWRGGAP